MKVCVIRLWRDGKLYPRWQLGTLEAVIGELRIVDCKDEHLRRHIRKACLFDFSPGKQGGCEVIPPLIDAAVLYIKGSTMSISGFESGGYGCSTVAQTWLVEVLEPECKWR